MPISCLILAPRRRRADPRLLVRARGRAPPVILFSRPCGPSAISRSSCCLTRAGAPCDFVVAPPRSLTRARPPRSALAECIRVACSRSAPLPASAPPAFAAFAATLPAAAPLTLDDFAVAAACNGDADADEAGSWICVYSPLHTAVVGLYEGFDFDESSDLQLHGSPSAMYVVAPLGVIFQVRPGRWAVGGGALVSVSV